MMEKGQKILTSLVCMALVTMFMISATEPVEAAEPKYGGVLRIGVMVESVDLDPHILRASSSAAVTVNICEGLTSHGPNYKVVPTLATSWDVSKDRKTYIFNLRKGVKFHNGREFTAEDVKWNFERIMSTKIVAYYGTRMRNLVKSVEVVDKYTVKIHLLTPAANFLHMLAHFSMVMIPREEVEAQGGTMTKPMGTGPFVFKERIRGQHAILEKFKDYWDPKLPYVDALKYIPMPEEASRVIALKTGEVDFIDYFPAKDFAAEKEKGNFKLYSYPGHIFRITQMNMKRPPLDNLLVRRAIRYAIDPKKFKDICFWGQGTLSTTGVFPEDPFNPKFPLWVYSPEIAKALLKQAGHENGFDLVYRVPAKYPGMVCAAEMIQADLKKVGIRVKLELMEWGDFQTKVARRKDYDLSTTGYGYYGDPDDIGMVYAKDAVFNRMHYDNPEVDELLKLGRQLMSFEERYPIYHQINRIVHYDCALIVQLFTNRTEASASYVNGYEPVVEGRPFWKMVWMAK